VFKRPKDILYAVLHAVFYIAGRLLFRIQAAGHHHIPKTGGVLVAANHASYLDIPLLGCMMKRQAVFVGKAPLFKAPILGRFYRYMEGIPIEQENNPLGGLREAIRRLREGRLVVIYPEGGRSRDGVLRDPMPGLGLIIAQAGVPVVPAYIQGTDRALPVGSFWIRPVKVTVRFGPPLDLAPILERHADRKEAYREMSGAVMDRIRQLSAQATPLDVGRVQGVQDKGPISKNISTQLAKRARGGGSDGFAGGEQGSGLARPSEGSGGSGASDEGGAHRPPDKIVGDASP
jgi:1-acyl-sn-glycerol-3-phosphate acyltransferase